MGKDILPTQSPLFDELTQRALIEGDIEQREMDKVACTNELYGKIWGKALRLKELDKKRFGDSWKKGYYDRFVNLLAQNRGEMLVFYGKDEKGVYKQKTWSLQALTANDKGFKINISVYDIGEENIENSPVVVVGFDNESAPPDGSEEREVYDCIQSGIEF